MKYFENVQLLMCNCIEVGIFVIIYLMKIKDKIVKRKNLKYEYTRHMYYMYNSSVLYIFFQCLFVLLFLEQLVMKILFPLK